MDFGCICKASFFDFLYSFQDVFWEAAFDRILIVLPFRNKKHINLAREVISKSTSAQVHSRRAISIVLKHVSGCFSRLWVLFWHS